MVCVSQRCWDSSITEGADRRRCHLEWLRLRARRRLQTFDTTLSHCLCFDVYGFSMRQVNQNHGLIGCIYTLAFG
jgi:hypothetical protein